MQYLEYDRWSMRKNYKIHKNDEQQASSAVRNQTQSE